MKIESVETTLVELPLPAGAGTSTHSMASVGCVLVEVRTDEGPVGQGFAFALDGSRLRSVDQMVRSFVPLVEGRDPFDTEAIWHDMWNDLNATGRTGATVLAMSAIDTACWDAAATSLELPLPKLFGACRTEVDTYASSGLWLSVPTDRLGVDAQRFVDQGFGAVKLRIGSGDRREDIARVRAVRESIGPDVGLLVDANQCYTAKEAIRLGRELEPFDLIWYEDPVSSDDVSALAEVRAAVAIPVAAGESSFTRFGLQQLIDRRGVDVVMPDLQRVGGLSEFRKAAAAASANHVTVSSHFFTEYTLCLAGSIHAMASIEHIDWFSPLFLESVELRDRKLLIPQRPGTGFTFDAAAVAAHRV